MPLFCWTTAANTIIKQMTPTTAPATCFTFQLEPLAVDGFDPVEDFCSALFFFVEPFPGFSCGVFPFFSPCNAAWHL